MPIWKIDQLQSEVSDIQNALSELRNATLSESEKKARENEIKSKAETAKQEIQWEINKLSWKTDAKSVAEKEKAETLLSTLTEILTLQLSIWATTSAEQTNTSPSPTSTEVVPVAASTAAVPATIEAQWDEKKWWLRRQWDAFTSKEKWKTETWANLLRAVWVVAVYKWIKWLWNKIRGKKEENENDKKDTKEDKKEDKKNEGGFWERPLWKAIKGVWIAAWISSWLYYVAHWIWTWNWEIRDMFDRERGKKLDFDDAMNYAEWSIQNQSNKDSMSYWMNLKYHEDTSEIEAYWQRIKIDKKARKIDWLKVTFRKYEHMISTAIVIAFLKKNYSWKCNTNSPFDFSWSRRWNINISTTDGKEAALDGSWNWGKILWVSSAVIAWIASAIWLWWPKVWATIWGAWLVWWVVGWNEFDKDNIMHNVMPELDDEYWKKSLSAYLNAMNCWEAGNQSREDITDSPIKDDIDAVRRELEESGTDENESPRWKIRKLDAIQDPNDPTKYTITAYDSKINVEILGEWSNRTLRILWLLDSTEDIQLDPEKSKDFLNMKLPLSEWIYAADLIGYLLSEFKHKWNKRPFFYYGTRLKLFNKWLYFNDDGRDTYSLTEKNFKKRMPELFKEKEKFVTFLSGSIQTKNGVEIWRDPKSYKKK